MSAEPPPSSKVTKWFAIGPFSFGLLILLICRFPGVFTGTEVFALRDYPSFGLPLAEYLSWSLGNGELPFWNPFNNCGLPFAAQWNTMVFYPPNWVFAVVSPFKWLGLFCVMHVFLGGVGMHRLGKELTGSDVGATAAGIAYAFSGLLTNSLMWPNNVAAFGWFPWLFLLVRAAYRHGGGWCLAAGAVTGLQLCCGAPEVTAFSWLTILAGLIGMGAPKDVRASKLVARFGVVILIGVGLAAVQLLPFFELLVNSHRWGTEPLVGQSASWISFLRWVTPLLDTFATPAGPRYHAEQSWTHSLYCGLLPLLVVGLAINGPQRRLAIVLMLFSLVTGLLAIGGKSGLFAWVFGWLPMRFPVKLLMIQSFVFPLLCAFGLGNAKMEGRSLRVGIFLSAGLFLGAAAVLVFGNLEPERMAPAWNSFYSRLALAGLMAAMLFFLSRRTDERSQILCVTGIVLAMTADLLSHQSHLAPTLSREKLESVRPSLPESGDQHQVPPTRAALTARARYQAYFGVAPTMQDSWATRVKGVAANVNLRHRVPKTDGFFSLFLQPVADVENLIYVGPNALHSGILEILAVSHVIGRTNDFFTWTNPEPVSMVGIGAPLVFTNETNMLESMKNPNYSPRSVVFLNDGWRSAVTAQPAPDATVSEFKMTPHRISFATRSDAPTLATISQAWYPCWQARVDGETANVLPANHGLMAVPVPAGEHRVELVYEDLSFEIGRGITLLTALACGGALIQLRRRKTASSE